MTEIDDGSRDGAKFVAIQAGVVGLAGLIGFGYLYMTSSGSESVTSKSVEDEKNQAASRYSEQQTATPDYETYPDTPTNNNSLSNNGYLVRNNPWARYKIANDPTGQERQCVSKTNESPANTVVGMTVVVAGDPNRYDGKGTIYDGHGSQIGTWDSSIKLIGFEDLSSPAYADSVACEDR